MESVAEQGDALGSNAGRRNDRAAEILRREDQLQQLARALILHQLEDQRRGGIGGVLCHAKLHQHFHLALLGQRIDAPAKGG